ncbi:MAG: UDP-N-acetylglucosamine 2-epimerase (hydrolyzing) [Bdellovibrionales bacterium]|nr:UDP-N-acetylglucosamine 2-epimerase (hydrolyzing) [Bdellovibrionales bacterium]
MRRVSFVTFSRSDYASIRPVALAAEASAELGVKVIAGGSHLLKRFGSTIQDIRTDGYENLVPLEFMQEGDSTHRELADAYRRAVSGLFAELSNDKPDFLFILGDRWEMLAAATVAAMLRIPIVHHSGGDITQGSADNQTRYALSALSHLHLVAVEEHAARLVALGEETWRVHTTGEPALTALKTLGQSGVSIYEKLGICSEESFVLATFHPTSYEALPIPEQIEVFIKALSQIDDNLIITAPNPDAGSGMFLTALQEFAAAHERVRLFDSLGLETYYAAMASARFMIGNSSSGIWEAPSFSLPVINIGERQAGRLRSTNVIDVPLDAEAIGRAIKGLHSPEFLQGLKGCENKYVKENTIELIMNVLCTPFERNTLLAKRFVDPLNHA